MKWEDDGAWCGELTTRNTGECPNAVVVSRLSQILEETPHPKYNLTPKACQGILRRAERRGKDLPKLLKAVLIRQSQGTSPQERTEAPAPTEAPTSYAVRIRGGCDGGGKGALVQTEKSGTLGTGNDQTIFQSCITPWDCQSKRIFATSGEAPTLQGGIGGGVNNPAIFCMATQQGGAELRTDDRAPTLTAAAGMSGNNQPVVAIPINDKEAVLCAGFKLGNSEQARSIGYQEELSPTLNAECGGNKPAVVAPAVALDMTHACDVIRECGEQVPALQARMGTGGNQVPLTYSRQAIGEYKESSTGSTCSARDFKDSTDLAITHMVVRRLTPMECERLQGFPDHWTDIGEWIDEKGKKHKDADSPRYKALGNSIALPFWDWMLRRMARYLPEGATLGSLFDGIGGFPLCFERIHGKGTARWASEIEQFPIAVTKKHFSEEE